MKVAITLTLASLAGPAAVVPSPTSERADASCAMRS